MSKRLFWFALGFLAAGVLALVLSSKSGPTPSVLRLSIPELQGSGEFSSYENRWIQTTGVVTHLEASSSGVKRFFLQDEGQAVSCYLPRRLPLKLQVGQWATVEGMVNEYRPGNGSFSNTEIPILLMDQVKSGRPAALPEPRELDFSKMAQLSPSQAMEAYEPLESMLVRVRNPRVLDRFNDWESRRTVVAVIPDSVSANERNSVGTLTVTAREHSNRNWDSRYEFDFNAERIFIEHEGSAKISTVGTRLKDVVGVLDLSSGQPLLLPIDKLQIESEAKPKAAPLNLSAENGQMMIATYNLWNLSADDSERITKIAEQIADDLKAPDLVALAEVQDDSGTRNSIADLTLSSRKFAEKLTPALSKKGADYRYLDREPLRHREGGVPGGNIRVGFLYKPERVRPVGEPFRIPDDSRPVTEHLAFEGTRKALGSRFEFVPTNQPFFAIATHLKSKRGDDFVWKKNPQFDSEDQRVQQCLTLVNAVEALKASEPDLPILLMGDFNDYAKSNSLRILTESGFLTNVLDQLPPEEQFTYRYRGNVSTLDHILVSPELANQAQCQILHLNTISLDRAQLASDHDPIVATVVMD